jgi:putative addiction module killer protein
MYELKQYSDANGNNLFAEWLNSLKDRQGLARIAARLLRLENGNFGDCKSVGDGVWELRIDTGPGYRVYYAIENKKLVLLCHGGDKSSQSTDIIKAISRWKDWQTRG